jgi:hypothetical protein
MTIRSLTGLLLGPMLFAQFTQGSFEKNLAGLNCDTALVLKSGEIRDPICWSPDSKELGVKLQEHWKRLNLDKLVLKRLKWRNNLDIAGPVVAPVMERLSDR